VISLPTLRQKIFRSFLIMILLYTGFAICLMISVAISGRNSPKMLHENYDSIVAAARMKEAWNALDRPERFARGSGQAWSSQFERALIFEEGNITESGEKEIAESLRQHWDRNKSEVFPLPASEFLEMDRLLSDLVSVNEKKMFQTAQRNAHLSGLVMVGGGIYFLVSLTLALILADELSSRLSRALKSMAEALHRRAQNGKRPKLVEPDNLELLILTNEFDRLWDRVAGSEKLNVLEVVHENIKLESVLEAVDDGLLVIDMSGKVSQCNGCLLELIGLPMNQVRNHSWQDLPATGDNYLTLRALIREDMQDSQELELRLKDEARHFSARSRKIFGPRGTVLATLYLLQDMTAKRKREQLRSEFIDMLSHELKTPLQSMGTASELIAARKEELPENLRPLVETICEDMIRLRAIVGEFVQVTQSQSKVMKLKIEPGPIGQFLSEWVKPFQFIAKDRSIKVKFIQEESDALWAAFDRTKFPWVISNLLSNAIRFSPIGGEITVILRRRDENAEILVKDQGPGISQDDQLRMFEPFFQSSTVLFSEKQGIFGIGLTIAKEVVEAHDGRIEYYRMEPHGSEFRIVLPLSEPACI